MDHQDSFLDGEQDTNDKNKTDSSNDQSNCHSSNSSSAESENDEMAILIKTLRNEYVANFHEVIRDCDSFVAVHDIESLTGLGHRLKGNGTSYGFPEISEIGAKIEKLGNEGKFEEILKYIEKLRKISNEFRSNALP